MQTYKLLNIKVQTIPEHILKIMLNTFLSANDQHQIVTVNPEFVLRARQNKNFADIINNASLATIDGAGIIQALQFLGHDITLDQRITGNRLMQILLDIAIKKEHKILFCLKSTGLSKVDDFFINIKNKYPELEFVVADENTALEKARIFEPDICLVGFGAPLQEIWIYENLTHMPSVRVAVGVGGALDFLSGRIRRAPKIMRSLALEWLWRLSLQPQRGARIFRSIFVFYYYVLKYKYQNQNAKNNH